MFFNFIPTVLHTFFEKDHYFFTKIFIETEYCNSYSTVCNKHISMKILNTVYPWLEIFKVQYILTLLFLSLTRLLTNLLEKILVILFL